MANRPIGNTRAEVLENAALRYAPENELGVVFLFATLAKRLQLRVELIRAAYPDCIAYKKVGGREKRVRIEFEYKSRSFRAHKHAAANCDMIVCWEHDWPGAPDRVEIVELRRFFGLGWNVWIQPVGPDYKESISKTRGKAHWSVPSQASTGDLLLMYHTRPESCIKQVFKVVTPVRHCRADWKSGMDYMADIRLVARLAAPVFLEDLRRHKVVSTAGFVRGAMRGRPRATEYWSYIHEMLVRRNAKLEPKLRNWGPSML